MNKEKFLSFLSKEMVKEEDVKNRIEEERKLYEAGNGFVSQLSINRYLDTKLAELDLNDRLRLFSYLLDHDFMIDENSLNYLNVDIDSFAVILEENFNLDDMYKLDNVFIENLFQGRDIAKEDIKMNDNETINFTDILRSLVFRSPGMYIGDTPNLLLMLVVKKALLGSYIAGKNVDLLQRGEREVYNISVLK